MSDMEAVPVRQCNGITVAGGRIVHTDTCPLHDKLTAPDQAEASTT